MNDDNTKCCSKLNDVNRKASLGIHDK